MKKIRSIVFFAMSIIMIVMSMSALASCKKEKKEEVQKGFVVEVIGGTCESTAEGFVISDLLENNKKVGEKIIVKNSGDIVKITANTISGYKFDYWENSTTGTSEDDKNFSTSASYPFRVTKNLKLTAKFKSNTDLGSTFEVTLKNGLSENTTLVGKNNAVTLIADSVRGKQFLKWTVNGEDLRDENSILVGASYSYVITQNVEIVAVYKEAQKYSVFIGRTNRTDGIDDGYTVGGINGTFQFYEGETCSLVATPPDGMKLASWQCAGADADFITNNSFVVTKNVTIYGKWEVAPKLPTPSQDVARMNYGGNGTFETDRGMDSNTFDSEDPVKKNIDHIKIWIYEDKNYDAEPIAHFNYYKSLIYNDDKTITATLEGYPGNGYLEKGGFSPFMIKILGDDLSYEATYYIRAQLIAVSLNGEYQNSDLGDFSLNGWKANRTSLPTLTSANANFINIDRQGGFSANMTAFDNDNLDYAKVYVYAGKTSGTAITYFYWKENKIYNEDKTITADLTNGVASTEVFTPFMTSLLGDQMSYESVYYFAAQYNAVYDRPQTSSGLGQKTAFGWQKTSADANGIYVIQN